MAYNAFIPQPNDQLSQSQQDILENFTQLQNAFSENHIALATAGQGKHKHVTFPSQGATPASLATELVLFNKVYTVGATMTQEIFVTRDASATEFPMTAGYQTSPGYCYLGNGLLMKWGNFNAVGAGSSTHLYPVLTGGGDDIPAFGAVALNIQITAQKTGAVNAAIIIDATSTNDATQFSVYNTGAGNQAFDFIAIGVPA